MALICVMSVYEEEDLILRALNSLHDSGVDAVHVFDGAWRDFGEGPSRDATVMLAGEWGATVWQVETPWESQEAKRTFMFHNCGATSDDHIFVFDADEELEGRFPTLPHQHHNVMVKCVGPNDLPGIRGEWPNGDYAPFYKPELRVFAYHQSLECRWPGGYWSDDKRIQAYDGSRSALPEVHGVSFLHHGNDRSAARKRHKREFYALEHPRRAERQRLDI